MNRLLIKRMKLNLKPRQRQPQLDSLKFEPKLKITLKIPNWP